MNQIEKLEAKIAKISADKNAEMISQYVTELTGPRRKFFSSP